MLTADLRSLPEASIDLYWQAPPSYLGDRVSGVPCRGWAKGPVVRTHEGWLVMFLLLAYRSHLMEGHLDMSCTRRRSVGMFLSLWRAAQTCCCRWAPLCGRPGGDLGTTRGLGGQFPKLATSTGKPDEPQIRGACIPSTRPHTPRAVTAGGGEPGAAQPCPPVHCVALCRDHPGFALTSGGSAIFSLRGNWAHLCLGAHRGTSAIRRRTTPCPARNS